MIFRSTPRSMLPPPNNEANDEPPSNQLRVPSIPHVESTLVVENKLDKEATIFSVVEITPTQWEQHKRYIITIIIILALPLTITGRGGRGKGRRARAKTRSGQSSNQGLGGLRGRVCVGRVTCRRRRTGEQENRRTGERGWCGARQPMETSPIAVTTGVTTIDAAANGGLATQHPGSRPAAGQRRARALISRRGAPSPFEGAGVGRGRGNYRRARAKKRSGQSRGRGVVPVWMCGAEKDEDGTATHGGFVHNCDSGCRDNQRSSGIHRHSACWWDDSIGKAFEEILRRLGCLRASALRRSRSSAAAARRVQSRGCGSGHNLITLNAGLQVRTTHPLHPLNVIPLSTTVMTPSIDVL